MTPQEWRAQVGAHVEQQRGAQSIRQAAARAGISEGLWRQVESGRRPLRNGEYETVNPKRDTRARVATAIGWSPDSIDRLLAGLEPIEASANGSADYVTRSEFDQLRERIRGLAVVVDRMERALREAGALGHTPPRGQGRPSA